MKDIIWSAIARICSMAPVRGVIIRKAQRTPYFDIVGLDGATYVGRWWLFNAYGRGADGEATPARWPWLPSIRVHHIQRPDGERHLHDHPWNARTVVLDGWYAEEMPWASLSDKEAMRADGVAITNTTRAIFYRKAGYTGRIRFGHYHRICAIAEGGAWTLFFTWGKQGAWGFNVNGRKVPWREYLKAGAAS